MADLTGTHTVEIKLKERESKIFLLFL